MTYRELHEAYTDDSTQLKFDDWLRAHRGVYSQGIAEYLAQVKPCTHCGEPKRFDQFAHEPRNKNGRFSICKTCRADMGRASRGTAVDLGSGLIVRSRRPPQPRA